MAALRPRLLGTFLFARLGSSGSQVSLAYAYWVGATGAPNLSKAIAWARRAAFGGNVSGQLFLGNLLCQRGDRGDLEESARWYKVAADLGNLPALISLATCFEFGDGVEKDLTKAFELRRVAADRGSADAQLYVGRCLQVGQNVPRNLEDALRYARMATASGTGEANALAASILADISSRDCEPLE